MSLNISTLHLTEERNYGTGILKNFLLMLIKQKYGISKPHATAIFLVAVARN